MRVDEFSLLTKALASPCYGKNRKVAQSSWDRGFWNPQMLVRRAHTHISDSRKRRIQTHIAV